MTLRRIALLASLALVAAGVIFVGTSAASHSAASPYRVLMVAPLSGPLGGYGQEELTGLKAAALVLNKTGGVAGHPVQISTLDDQGNPSQGVTLLQNAIQGSNKPNFVIPGIAGFEHLPYVPILTQAKILSFGGSAIDTLNNTSKFPYHFAINPGYKIYWLKVVATAKKNGVKSAYVLANDDAVGHSNATIMQSVMKQDGIKLTGVSFFEDQAVDDTPVFQKAQATHPDGIFVTDQGQSSTWTKSRANAGVTIPTYCDSACAATPLASLVGADAVKGVYGLVPPIDVTPPAQRSAAQKAYIAALNKFGGSREYVVPGLPYDSLMVINEAATQAHSIDSVAVANALTHLKAPQAFAAGYKIHFTAKSHFALQLNDPDPFQEIQLSRTFANGWYNP